MRGSIHDEAVELLLSSMSQKGGEGLPTSFYFGKPGARQWERNFGVDFYYKANKLNRAALYVREKGPAYLKYLAISDIWSLLQDFVRENYWYLMSDTFFIQFDGSYAERISAIAKLQFSDALAVSEIFQPRNQLTLFPLVSVQVKSDFDSEVFFLTEPGSLTASKLPSNIDHQQIAPAKFPPLMDFKGRQEFPNSWLGIRAPAIRVSNKMKAAILGALALTPLPRYRHSFSDRKMFGGYCSIGDSMTFAFGAAHTPPLMQNILITKQDHVWLNTLSLKLAKNERAVRRQIKALEYFYRAWELEPSERFPVLCMTLDAIFGNKDNATQAVIDGVKNTLGHHISDSRLRQLMQLRASVIHGGAPDVYDSRKYGRYYDDYEADPIHDLELVAATCLRLQIFGGALKEHPDPNAQIIAEAQAKGRLPKNLSLGTILEDFPTSDTL